MKEIKLSNTDLVALVDDEDFDKVSQYNWWAKYDNPGVYACCCIGKKKVLMHRLILDVKDKPTPHVDHINRSGIDNRRCNLRFATQTQNHCNSRKRHIYGGKPTSSRFKGVSFNEKAQKWYVITNYKRKKYYMGSFSDEIEAAKAYNKFAKREYGEFARLNEV